MAWFSRRPVVVQIPEPRKEIRVSLKPHDLLEHLESGNRMEVHLKNPVATSGPQSTMPSLQRWPLNVLESYERSFQQLNQQGWNSLSLQVLQNIGGIV